MCFRRRPCPSSAARAAATPWPRWCCRPADAWVGWKPRSRDVKNEKPVFYAEISQLYVPSAGVVEGVHQVSIRPAQGELGELIFNVPAGATITDVSRRVRLQIAQSATVKRQSVVSLWRFDPDTRKLRVTLNPAQSRPFALVIRSQVATGTLPFEQRVGLISVEGAAGQIGLLGVATGNEVQLDDVGARKNFRRSISRIFRPAWRSRSRRSFPD